MSPQMKLMHPDNALKKYFKKATYGDQKYYAYGIVLEDNANSVMNNDGMILLPGQNTEGQINTSSETLFLVSDHSNYKYDTNERYTDLSIDDLIFPEDEDSELEQLKRRFATYMDMVAIREDQGEGQHHQREFKELTDMTLQQQELQRAFEAAMDEGLIRGFFYGVYMEDCSVMPEPAADGQQSKNSLLDPTGEAMMPEVSVDGSGGNFEFPTIELHDQKEQIGVNHNSSGQFTAPFLPEYPAQTSPNQPLVAPHFPVI